MTHRRNYQNGKVYAISNSHDDKIYVGATCTSLERRLCSHRTKSRNDAGSIVTLYQQMRLHGEDNYFITLLEDVPCSDARTLHAREGHWIREMGTLNRRISGRTLAQYYMDNQQSIIDKVNAYALKNREKLQTKITCDCGGAYIFRARAPHLRTKRHLAHMDFIERMSFLLLKTRQKQINTKGQN